MIQCNQCFDYDLVKSVMSNPYVLPNIMEDIDIDIDWNKLINDKYLYYTFKENDTLYGVGVLNPLCLSCWEVHSCLLPTAKGKGEMIINLLMAELLELPYVEKLIARIPEFNTKTIQAAEKVGFVKEGYISSSWRKDGKLIGQYIYGVTL